MVRAKGNHHKGDCFISQFSNWSKRPEDQNMGYIDAECELGQEREGRGFT